MRSGLLAMIAAYDQDRDTYVAELESEIKALKIQVNELMSLAMTGEAIRDKVRLDAILAGAYDRLERSP